MAAELGYLMLSEVTEVFVGTKLFVISILVKFSEITVTSACFPVGSLIKFVLEVSRTHLIIKLRTNSLIV